MGVVVDKRQKLSFAWALAGMALIMTALAPATIAFAAPRADTLDSSTDPNGTPTFTTEGSVASFRTSRTVPYWSGSFTDPTNQVTYPFTMVGSDPRLGGSTTVATEIIPLEFNFVAGNQDVSVLNVPNFPPSGYFPTALPASMDATGNALTTVASPIFTPTNFGISGDPGVQYGDAVMRAQFGQVGTGYHVTLGQPAVMDTVSIDVPQSHGVAVLNPLGVLVGRVEATWFRAHLHRLLGSLHIDPTTLPIFLTQNVFLYQDNDFTHCCSIGGHGAGSPTGNGAGSINGKGNQPVQTFIYAAYLTPNSFPRFPAPFAGLSDINALSHEVSEWMDNPFGNNAVQPWLNPISGECIALLETGDPLAGVWFPVPGNPNRAARGVWHPQDEAFLNWFARDGENPGLAPADGRYTYMGPITTHIPRPPFIPLPGFAGFGQVAQAC
jgi:hypothetical protein